MTDDRDDEPRAPDSLVLHHARRLHDPAGREAAHRYLHDAYYDRLRGFFSRQGLGPEKARDLTQETFLRVSRGSGEFASAEELEAWLFRIARNVYLNDQRNRRAKKRDAAEQSLEQWMEAHGSVPEPPGNETESPLEAYLERERHVLLARSLTKLPAKMRRCFVLRLHHGLSYQEIADRLGVSIGTVKAHLHQARSRLNDELADLVDRSEPPGERDSDP
jgi:RNA polymerase sigma-70 factor (ECF subfamily)